MHKNGREPGVWFFSLDAANLPAVLAARPASPCRTTTPRAGSARWAASRTTTSTAGARRRVKNEPLPARFNGAARIGDLLGVTEPGTLEFFLIERYILYADWRARAWG